MRPGLPHEAKNAELFMHEIRSVCLVVSRSPSEMVLNPAKVSLQELHELTGQESSLQKRHAAPEPGLGEVTKMKDENEMMVVYGDLWSSSGMNVSKQSPFCPCCVTVRCFVCWGLGILSLHLAAQ